MPLFQLLHAAHLLFAEGSRAYVLSFFVLLSVESGRDYGPAALFFKLVSSSGQLSESAWGETRNESKKKKKGPKEGSF